MTRLLAGPARLHRHLARNRSVRRATRVTVLAFITAIASAMPAATADATSSLAAALNAARSGSCGPLRSNPIVQQAAADSVDSTDKWLNHTSRAVPLPEAGLLLKDLGYGGTKSALLTSSGKTAADAIKALLLQGYLKIPDCSYVDYGASSMHNVSKDVILASVVLAG